MKDIKIYVKFLYEKNYKKANEYFISLDKKYMEVLR